MKTIVGKILSIEIDVNVMKADNSGTYKGWRLSYQTPEGKVEQIAKPMAGLKYQPALKAQIDVLGAGDEITIEMEKSDKGYWEILSIRKGMDMPAEKQGASVPQKQYKTDKQYETAEERQNKQVYIVRQTCLDRAVELAIADKVKVDGLLKAAEKFEAWVMRKEETGGVE